MPWTSHSLRDDIDAAGFYPELVAGVLDVAIADEPVRAHLVHPETSFDSELRRHLTALVITASRFVVTHVDDVSDENGTPGAIATTESVALRDVSSVALTHGVSDPARNRDVQELTLAIGWGANRRVDLEPATCADPECTADHGYTGAIASEDVVLRVASGADGEDALGRALAFARELSAATAGVR